MAGENLGTAANAVEKLMAESMAEAIAPEIVAVIRENSEYDGFKIVSSHQMVCSAYAGGPGVTVRATYAHRDSYGMSAQPEGLVLAVSLLTTRHELAFSIGADDRIRLLGRDGSANPVALDLPDDGVFAVTMREIRDSFRALGRGLDKGVAIDPPTGGLPEFAAAGPRP